MLKLILILLQILLANNAVLTASIANSENDLIYIGTFRSPNRGNSRVIDENNYYISPNAASWNSASAVCKNQLGENGTLVAIESEEEWNFLKENLEDYGFGTTYWTSGMYDPSKSIQSWIELTNALSRGAISSGILATPYDAGNTATALGIDLAVSDLISNERVLPLNLVILTDGESNDPDLSVDAAKRATDSGIRTFSVGITPSVNQQELLVLAGNDANRVFTTASFDELIKLLAPLSVKVCPLE